MGERRIGAGEPRLLNRYFILVWLAGLGLQICQSALNAYLSVYVTDLGFSTAFSGLLGVPYALFAIAARFLAGYFVDRVSRRWAMAAGCAIMGASCLLFGLVPTAAGLLLFRGLQGMGFALGQSGASTANVDVTPSRHKTLGIGIFWTVMACSLGVTGVLVERLSKRGAMTVFVVLTVCVLAGAGCAAFCNYEHRGPFAVDRSDLKNGGGYRGLRRFLEKRGALPAVLILLLFVADSSLFSFIMLFAAQQGLETGFYFLLLAVVMTAFNTLSGRLIDRFGAPVCVLAGNLACGVTILLLGLVPCGATYYLSAVGYGLSFGVNIPALNFLAVDGLPQDRRGAAGSTALLGTDIGAGVGSLLWGAVIDGAGFSVTYIAAGCVGLFAAALTLFAYFRPGRGQPG